MKKIKVKLIQNPYDVIAGYKITGRLVGEILKSGLASVNFFIIDRKAYLFHKKRIDEIFNKYPGEKFRFFFDSTESKKSYEELQRIHKVMLKAKLGRNDFITAIGGGILGDVAGFAASTYMRGINYVQIPTTLLSAVDSSVGGKTGINFSNTKNVIGAFHQPRLVFIDTAFFKTLPKEEIICGIGELVKYSYIISGQYYRYLNNNLDKTLKLEPKVTERLVFESVKFKGAVVENDEKEGGLRKVLNFGHTFAHAIEVEQNYRIKHGQAVIAGIGCALYLSYIKGFLNERRYSDYIRLIQKFSGQIKIRTFDKKNLYRIMERDKKTRDGNINFVLLKDIGELIIDVNATRKEIYSAIEMGLSNFN